MKRTSLAPFGTSALLSLFTLLTLAAGSIAFTQDAAQDLSKVDADYAIQGEYSGTADDADQTKVGVQVIAMGDGKFQAVGYMGGLPGDGWDGEKPDRIDGKRDGDGGDAIVKFDNGGRYSGDIKKEVMTIFDEGKEVIQLKRVERKSPTLGKKPPEGALVFFDGSNLDHFKKGAKMTDDGLLMQGSNTKTTFGSGTLHLEFRTPYKPKARGQGRGNSGCYMQARYEVQVLDSFGLEGKHNECGGVYSVKDPDMNMCFPPLTWQTYDIEFTAAEFDGDKKTKNARMTVRHNGVVVHDDIEVPKRTTASPLAEGKDEGYLHLQNHGNPVRYRNIWFVEK